MHTPSPLMRRLIYDPNERYEEYCLRRQHAVEQGRQAVRERQISGDLFLLYEYLIERVGANTYTWVKEETLAEVFHVDASTIKRWMAKLVRAGLIRRQRQFARSSRTYISAYDPSTILLDGEAELAADHDHAEPAPEEDPPEHTQVDLVTNPEARSFRRIDAPTFGADLPRDHIKDSHLTFGGGGMGSSQKNQASAPELRLLLEREGVSGFYLAPQLHHIPLDELRAVSRYLDQQHNIRDRARLFAALGMQGFGALLLAGRAPQSGRGGPGKGRPPKAQPPQGDNHLKYISGACAPYIQGANLCSEAAPDSAPTPPLDDQHATAYAQTWQQVLAAVRPSLPDSEFRIWFEESCLLHLDDGLAVIGTPHIFARDKLTSCYEAQIVQALQERYGRPVQVQVVLGTTEYC